MNIYERFCNFLSNALEIKLGHVTVILNTIMVILIIALLKKVGKYLISSIKEQKKEFLYSRSLTITLNILEAVLLMLVWYEYIEGLMTLISVLSAAFAIALRDIILNWFCGIYNQIKKVFKIEDRIEINGIKGDVINISTLSFEILEVSEKEENGQSTGVIINFPNSVLFSNSIKNITKGFKYVWNEMVVRLKLDADLQKNKQELYKIINNIEEIKNTPKKMQNALRNINVEYRIYYNQYNPVIYTKIVNGHIELTIRYLINPRKARFIESTIWNQILAAYSEQRIELYDKES